MRRYEEGIVSKIQLTSHLSDFLGKYRITNLQRLSPKFPDPR